MSVGGGLKPLAEPMEQPLVAQNGASMMNLPGQEAVQLRDLAGIEAPIELDLDPKARILTNSLRPVVLERYRRLRTKLIQEGVGTSVRSVMVTSATPEEGKTLTVLNLALSFAMLSPYRVVVVDGDLRCSSIAQWLGAPYCPGLGNLIDGTAKLKDVVRKSEQFPIHLIFAGDSTEAPAELLEPTRLRQCVNQLTQYFDLVLIDSPPINLIADTHLLAQSCDGIVLVARAYSTKRKAFEKAVHDLAGHRILGAVLNAGSDTRDYGRYRSGYY